VRLTGEQDVTMHPVRRRTRWTVALTVTGLAAAGLAAGQAGPAAAVPPPAPGATAPAAGVQAQDAAGPVTDAAGPLDGALAARDRLPGRTVVAVRFRAGVKAAAATRATAFAGAVRRLGATTRSTADAVGAATFVVPDAGVDGFVAEMQARPDVTEARVATLYSPTLVPNDPQYKARQKAYLSDIGLESAWTSAKGSANVLIAVVDTGVDVGHPDLAGKIAGSWNTVSDSTVVTDQEGHGTFVAGVAAAATNNGVGIAGAGYNSRVLAVKVADPSGFMADVDVAEGIRWAADNGAKIINISLGSTTGDADTKGAVAYAQSKGALVVASAGNAAQEGNPKIYPAAYPGVVAVGATLDWKHRAWFSEHGDWVTIAAPGVDIRGTTPRAGSRLFPANYATGNGTSFAAPIVAGIAALHAARDTDVTPAELRSALTRTARPMTGFGLGAGQVNALKMVDAAVPTATPQIQFPADGSTQNGFVNLGGTLSTPRAKIGWYVGSTRVASSFGTGTATWDTDGWPQGRHTLQARACSWSGACAGSGPSVEVTVDNPAPVVGGPADGDAVSGPVAVSEENGGAGGFAVLVDGTRVGSALSSRSVSVNFSALDDGAHSIRLVACSSDRKRCDGPQSAPVTVTSDSLHPTVRISSNPSFSPNGDGVKESTTVTYTVDTAQTVTLAFLDSNGSAVRTVKAGLKQPGTYTYTWKGLTDAGTAARSNGYVVSVDSKDTAGRVGRARTRVQLDRVKPGIGVLGFPATFYPAKDGYKDSWTPRIQVGEPAQVTLTVRNARGTVVRRLTARRGEATVVPLSWDGRNASGTRVPAGTYSWKVTAKDDAGNSRTSDARSVTVKSGVLTTKTVTLTKAGDAAYAGGGSATCARTVTAGSTYGRGLWLKNNCARSNPQNALAFYRFKVPAAVTYTSFKVVTSGRAHSAPSDVVGGVLSTQTTDYDITPAKAVSSTATQTLTLGRITGPGHAPNRVVDVVVFVPNERAPLVDWDVRNVKLTVTYTAPA
jgi:subtilisin family serine protease/flagellar hook assembly protein FlgD